MIEPTVGIYNYNYADTAAGTTTNYSGTWFGIGADVFYVLHAFSNLTVQVGPGFFFSTEAYKPNGNPDNFQFTYWAASLNLQLLAMLNRNLGVFTSLGLEYWSQDTKDTTVSTETLLTEIQIINPSLGVVYYFK